MLHEGRHPLGPDLHPEAAPINDRAADGRRCGNCRFRQTTKGRPKCAWGGEQQNWHLDANAWWPGCRDHQWEGEDVIGIRIADVKIGNRARKDLGDLTPLMASIGDLTLLQPIVITHERELIAGQRRLEACKRLGWEAIPAVVAEDITDAVDRVKAERDENTCRKDMTASELIELGKVIQEMERPKAEQRKAENRIAGRAPDGTFAVADRPNGNGHEKFDSREKAAEAVGMSTAMYSRLKQVHDAANDVELSDPERARAQTTMNTIDRIMDGAEVRDEEGHKVSVTRAYELWRGVSTQKRKVPIEDPKTLSKDKAGVEERTQRVRELAASGHNSHQIADLLGYGSVVSFRNFARTNGIEIPADAVKGKTRNIDSNRVVRETVHALEGLAMGVQLANLHDLDAGEIENWAASLTDSTRTLTRFARQIKEMTQ